MSGLRVQMVEGEVGSKNRALRRTHSHGRGGEGPAKGSKQEETQEKKDLRK